MSENKKEPFNGAEKLRERFRKIKAKVKPSEEMNDLLKKYKEENEHQVKTEKKIAQPRRRPDEVDV